MHVELRVEQHYRLAAFTSRAADLMLIENLTKSNAACHGRCFGRGRHLHPVKYDNLESASYLFVFALN